MNYRHAFHAGNFADVVKHAVLARIVVYLRNKEKAFRVIDTHAGPGVYELGTGESARTGEWKDGVARLLASPLPDPAAALLQPYLGLLHDANPTGDLTTYPGSPLIARKLLRRQDRLTAVELHPQDAERLRRLFAGDVQTRVIHLDGWLALGAHLPPKEKRGLVLVDPPFEQAGEFERLASGLELAHRRWPGGIYALWYPIKDRSAVARFRQNLAVAGISKLLDIRFEVRGRSTEPGLDGCGIVVANPPFTLADELRTILPVLRDRLAQDGFASFELVPLSEERVHP